MFKFGKKKEEKLNEEIAILKHELEDLKQVVKTQELLRLRAENERLREKEKMISKVHLTLKSIAFSEEENKIVVRYEVPNLWLSIDQNGDIVKNDMFYAINFLQLLSTEDMKKEQNLISNVQKTLKRER